MHKCYRKLTKLFLLAAFTVYSSASSTGHIESRETFEEDLVLRPLPDGKVLARFAFTTKVKGGIPRDPRSLGSEDAQQHYTLFPLSFGQILREYAITELHLTLNAGVWNYDTWGYPEEIGVGTGSELWTWMADGGPHSVDQRWSSLRNGLAGLICASLGSMSDIRTTSPSLSFHPEGHIPNWNVSHALRHATLPSEHVCTENLTPFLKLLPSKGISGIASLLNPHRVLDADWHGMGLHVTWDADEGVVMKSTIQAVLDPMRKADSRRYLEWSLESLFGRKVERGCQTASSSFIRVHLPSGGIYGITPEPEVHGDVGFYNAKSLAGPLDIRFQWNHDFEKGHLELSDVPRTNLSIQRILRGSSQALGQLTVAIQNFQPEAVRVIYLETMPWLLQFYLHTIQIHVDGILRNDLISNISYIPPIAHGRPATFQSILTLPGGSLTIFTIEVTKAFLRYTEHPPDAQRGWDLPPAVFTPLVPQTNNSSEASLGKRIYTSTLLVDLATPDFSMPYNVIVLSCTLIAFIFGTIFNLLIRKLTIVKLEDSKDGQKMDDKKEAEKVDGKMKS